MWVLSKILDLNLINATKIFTFFNDIIQVIMIFQAMVKFEKLHNYYKINFQKIIVLFHVKQCQMRHNRLSGRQSNSKEANFKI